MGLQRYPKLILTSKRWQVNKLIILSALTRRIYLHGTNLSSAIFFLVPLRSRILKGHVRVENKSRSTML